MDRQERQIGVRLSYADKYAYEMLVDTNRFDHDGEYCIFSSPLEFMREAIKDQFEKHFTKWSKQPDSPFNVYDKLPVEKFPAEVPVTFESLSPNELEHWHRCRWATWEDTLANSSKRQLSRGVTTNLSFDDVMELVRGGFLAPQMLSEFTGGESVHYCYNKDNGDLIERWKTACGVFERVDPQPEPHTGWDPCRVYWRAGKSKPNKTSPSLDLSKATTVVEHDISADLHFKMIELDGVKYSVHTHLKNGKPSGEPVVKRIGGDSDTIGSTDNVVSPDAAAGVDADQEQYAARLQKWEDRLRKYDQTIRDAYGDWFGSPTMYDELLSKALKCENSRKATKVYADALPASFITEDSVQVRLDPSKNKRVANFLEVIRTKADSKLRYGKSLRSYYEILGNIEHRAHIDSKWHKWWERPLDDAELIEFCQDPINSIDACFLAIAARTELRANFLKETYLKFDSVRPVLEQIRNGSYEQPTNKTPKLRRSARGLAYQNLQILKQGKSMPGTRPRHWSHLIYFLNPKLNGYWMTEMSAFSVIYLTNSRVVWINTAGFLGDENSASHYESYCCCVEALAMVAKVDPSSMQVLLSGRNFSEWSRLVRSKEVGATVRHISDNGDRALPFFAYPHPSQV